MKVHDEPAGKPPGYEPVSDEAEKVHVLQTPNAGFRTTFYLGKDSKVQNMAQVGEKPAGYQPVSDEAEKVHVLQTPNAGYRTTFYAQQLAQAERNQQDMRLSLMRLRRCMFCKLQMLDIELLSMLKLIQRLSSHQPIQLLLDQRKFPCWRLQSLRPT